MGSNNANNLTDDRVEYFLSVYMQAPDITALTMMRHDNCAALWRQQGSTVTLQRYWEFERISGLKHHRISLRHPESARSFLNELLAEEGLSLDHMTQIWGTPHLLTENEFVKRQVPDGHTAHSVAHLFSAIGMDWEVFTSGSVLGLAFDAGPDVQLDADTAKTIYSGCVVNDGRIEIFAIESPGVIWLLARGRFKKEEGTLMALASATTCRVPYDVIELVDQLPFWTQAETFTNAATLIDRCVDSVTTALAVVDDRAQFDWDDRFTEEENLQSAVMKLLDEASCRVVDRTIERARKEYELDLTRMRLAICGGYALNCPNNSRVMDKYAFAALMAPPCANDGGQALGIGVMALHDRGATAHGGFQLGNAFHGRTATDMSDAIQEFAAVIDEVTALDLERVVDDLIEGPIAWVQGKAEIGPRALGHRSLLGDPRSAQTKSTLNRIKQRQWWRPVAPIVLEGYLDDWFINGRPSPYMLEVFTAQERARREVPDVLHLDGTARVQTVNADQDGPLTDLLETWHARTGVPIVANTSLNDKGEPLVDTAAEAFTFCVRKGLRVAYVDGHRVTLRADAQQVMALPNPRPRRRELFDYEAQHWAQLWNEWTDQGLPPMALFAYAYNPLLRDLVDPSTPEGARRLHIAAEPFLSSKSDRVQQFVADLMEFCGPDADPIKSSASLHLIIGG
jgi:carbamoyltransferase